MCAHHKENPRAIARGPSEKPTQAAVFACHCAGEAVELLEPLPLAVPAPGTAPALFSASGVSCAGIGGNSMS